MNMIVDRTLLDVERWRELRDKGWSRMTPVERQEWMGEITPVPSATRGMYTHNDLNRVERAVEATVARFKEAGYELPSMVTKTDWTHRDKPQIEDIERYYNNISLLREFLVVYPKTPKSPSVDKPLNYEMANNIEKIIVDVNNIITGIMTSWFYAGDVMSGEV